MIQIYKANTAPAVLQGLTRNGDRVLQPTSCVQHLVLNGVWELTMSLPLDGSQSTVEVGATIRAPGHNGTEQLFRVFEVTPSLAGTEVRAYPIFMQAAQDVFLNDVRPTNQTGQGALNAMIAGAVSSGSGYTYTATSNITTTNTAYYIRKNLIEAIQGEDDTAFLNRWGGEVYYSNFSIDVRTRQGADRGMVCRYGYNMTGCAMKVNTEEVITRIVPVAFNGRTLPGVFVDSPLIASYPFVRTRVIHYDDMKLTADLLNGEEAEAYDTEAELQAAMTARAEREFSEGHIDLPAVSYDISLAQLENTAEYAGINGLTRAYLGDTIHCYNARLGIQTDARVVEIYYDCILQRVQRVILGDYRSDYFARLSKAARTIGTITDSGTQTVKADRIAGIINAMQAQLRLQNTAAERSDVRAILFEDTDPTSPLYGAMSIGTQGFQIANTRLLDGSDWDWKTFGTAAGFSAEYIIAGILASQNFDGTQGVAIDLNRGILYAPQFTIGSSQVTGFSDLSDTVEGLAGEMGDLSEYFRTGNWGSNNDFGAAVVVGNNMVLITGTAVSLIQNGNIDDPVAVLNQETLEVTHGVFKDDLTIGCFKWIPRTNGGMSLVYVGG